MRNLVFTYILVVASTALAAEGGHGGHSPLELIWKGVNILAFLGIVYWFGRKPIAEAFNNFWNSIIARIEDSERELREAKEELQRAKEELEKAKVRADESIALARESAQSEIENAKKHAQEVAQRVKDRAKETIEVELQRAKKELAAFGILKAEEIAKDMLSEAFSKPEVQKGYVERQLKNLEGTNG
jgi:F-type H+-transporting ATPase subunit b